MIRTEILNRCISKLVLDLHDFTTREELIESINEFFETDPEVVGTENEGRGEIYHEAIIESLQQLIDILEENL